MRWFEDFAVDDVYALGSRSLSADDIVSFARDYDPQPLHLGTAEGGPDGLIASGWQVASVFMRLYVDALVNGSAADVSPGVDELRWLRPVRPGDVLTGEARVLGTSPSLSRPDCGIVHQRGELADATGRPVLRLHFHGLVRRRSAGVRREAG